MTLRSDDFAVARTYLDSAARHPLPLTGGERLAAYGELLQAHGAPQNLDGKRDEVRALFARLVNVLPDEIAVVPSTTWAERLILTALGLPGSTQGIVTDDLHYATSRDAYRAMRDSGAAITIVEHHGGRIDPDRMAAAITAQTQLVIVSSVSHWNGFQHDLRTISDIAHARGALVYADVVQQAGAMPLDLRASGVDFAAAATYKWLLGDFGLAFLYVRQDRLDILGQSLRRLGIMPFAEKVSGDVARAADLFGLGTIGGSAIEILRATLPMLIDGGVAAQVDARNALLAAIDAGFEDLPLTALSPPGNPAPIRAFAGEVITDSTIARVREGGVRVTARSGYLRIAPAIFNTQDDIAEAIAAILAAVAA